MIPLPIDPHVDAVRGALRRARAAVVSAQPGTGKTTRIPPALTDAGPVILLQPRRVAARAVAARIAGERGWTVGEEVGWQIRFERRASRRTRLLVVTEGILTARLQRDPLLTDFATIVIDEFHERSIHADLALALAKQAWRARDDLRIVVMSATLDGGAVSAFLDDCPIIDVPGRTHPLDIAYDPESRAADVVRRLAALRDGDILCFMPGAGDIRRTISEIVAGGLPPATEVLPLYGALDGAEQDRVLAAPPPGITRVIVATNVAETSLTVPGIRSVVDAGWQKVARYDPARGIDCLETERITQDAADQRAGRAGRVGRGRVVRLWDSRDRLRPHREADIQRIDLAGTVLDILAWGGEPMSFEWFDAPRRDRIVAAVQLLERIGAVHDGRLTDRGRETHRFPLHPRLAAMLVDARGHRAMVQACALLSERHVTTRRRQATTSDLLSALDEWDGVPAHVRQVADDISRVVRSLGQPDESPLDEYRFRHAVFTAFADRVGRRREPASTRVKLATGSGAILAADSGVIAAEYLVALDLRSAGGLAVGGRHGPPSAEDGVIHLASQVEPEWLVPTAATTRCWFDAPTGQVRAALVDHYDQLILRERATRIDDEAAAVALADAWIRRGLDEDDTRLLCRMRFAGHDPDVEALMRAAAYGRRALRDLHLAAAVDPAALRQLDRDAPETVLVPSGRRMRLEYAADGGVRASVKLQELFGLAETPRIGPHRQPVLLALLSPGGRPVQLTQDLRSFWNTTYPQVRRELRGRYPKHPWPEDPWRAVPTARTRRPLS